MARTLRFALVAFAAALVLSGNAQAGGGKYVFAGATPAQQAQVRQALNASAFPWSIVPGQITIHVAPGVYSEATPGNLWINAELLNSGRFAWAIIPHEYAHQVDFFLLDDAKRAALAAQLGGQSWWQTGASVAAHSQLTSERFASTLAWAYWLSRDNVLKPTSRSDESAAMAPAAFRALLAQTLGLR